MTHPKSHPLREAERIGAHTPGPWSITIHTGDGRVIDANSDWSCNGPNGESICFEGRTNPNADANARLIAAAPELLSALSGLVAIIDAAGLQNLTRGVQLGQISWAVKATDRMDAAGAAIVKARGQ